jgi:hypothetical protein
MRSRKSQSKKDRLERLKKKWAKKLEKSGFDDIEIQGGSYLKRCTWTIAESYSSESEQYYIWARQYSFDGLFVSPTEKRIWDLHSEGQSYDSILRQIPGWTSRSPIQRIILKHKAIMLSDK